MTERIILSILCVLMLLFTLKRQGRFHKIITITLTAGILVTWSGSGVLVTIGILLFMLGTLLSIVYVFVQKGLTLSDKTIMSIIGSFVLVNIINTLNHNPYANMISLLMIIPVLLFLLFLIIKKDFKNLKQAS